MAMSSSPATSPGREAGSIALLGFPRAGSVGGWVRVNPKTSTRGWVRLAVVGPATRRARHLPWIRFGRAVLRPNLGAVLGAWPKCMILTRPAGLQGRCDRCRG